MIIEETLVVDLTRLKPLAGKLIPGVLLELRLIELYRLHHTDETEPIGIFTNEVLKHVYNDDVNRHYDEIVHFYRERDYINIVFGFINTLEYILLNKTPPDVADIVFDSYKVNTDIKLEVVFKIFKFKDTNEE
jgi:hypothetical protein